MTTPAKIDPDAIYDAPALRLVLPIGSGTLARARRDGTLRYKRIGTRTLYRGSWLLDWIEGRPPEIPGRSPDHELTIVSA